MPSGSIIASAAAAMAQSSSSSTSSSTGAAPVPPATPLNQSNNTLTTPASVMSCSLFEDNYLYPQLDYRVDLSKISAAINDLSVQIGRLGAMTSDAAEAAARNPTNPTQAVVVTQAQPKFNITKFENDLERGVVLDAIVSTGILHDGMFWMQPATRSSNEFELLESAHKLKRVQLRVNLYLDEVSKYVRRKRIGDDAWATYAEMGQIPKSNLRAFFF